MGTRSVIKFQENGDTICAVYQQYDGYIEGVGKELFNFLKGITLVNGISINQSERIANGMGCLAAQFIAETKIRPGGLYMTNIVDSEEYNYIVNSNWSGLQPGTLIITVSSCYDEDPMLHGSLEDFGHFIETYNGE